MTANSRTDPGMLFVAADVAAEDDADFNDWYDREHIEERARIAGFVSAARYRSVQGGRRYLGLYRTESLGAFTTPAYRAAFARQTPWSVTNLGRMVSPMRRVCTVTAEVGQGSGSWLSVLPLNANTDASTLTQEASRVGALLATRPGFVHAYLLTPDAALSTPLPNEATQDRHLLPLFVIETSTSEAQAAALNDAALALPCDVADAASYALGWKLFSHEVPPSL